MTLRRMLVDGAGELGLRLSDEQADACLVYLVELEKWNRKLNLTAIRKEQEIVVKHFIDSFSYLKGFRPQPDMDLLDMGSGAGFPALAIKILSPDLTVTLVESVKKKGTFLRHIIRTLKMTGVEVLDARTEDLPAGHLGRYDIVTARAFADIASALHEGSRFLKPGGLAVLSRGPAETVSDDAVKAIGMTVVSRQDIALPGSGDPRSIWVFEKV